MIKYLFMFFLTFPLLNVSGQAGFPYQDIKLEKPGDYAATEPLALSAANFIMTTAFELYDKDRAVALQFLSNWVTGATNYSFHLKGKVTELASDANVLSLFIAALVKYTLENKAEAVNPIQIDAKAAEMVLAYCANEKNNFKLKKKYKRILESE